MLLLAHAYSTRAAAPLLLRSWRRHHRPRHGPRRPRHGARRRRYRGRSAPVAAARELEAARRQASRVGALPLSPHDGSGRLDLLVACAELPELARVLGG